MNPAEVEQNSAEWRQCRAGFITASRIVDVMRKPRKGADYSATRKAYITQLVAERISGKPQEREFESFDTRRGLQLEPIARAEYELQTAEEVLTIGFVEHPRIKLAGCSPDCLVGKDGLAQFKAPRAHVHLDWILAGIVPPEHRAQMYFEMACTGRSYNDFVSYCPGLPGHELFIRRLPRDEAAIQAIEDEVVKLNGEVEDIMKRLEGGKTSLEESLEISLEDIRNKL